MLGLKNKLWKTRKGCYIVTISGTREITSFMNTIYSTNQKGTERKYYNAQYVLPTAVSVLLRRAKEHLGLHYGRELPEGLFEGAISGRKRTGLFRLRRMFDFIEKHATPQFRKNDTYKALKI